MKTKVIKHGNMFEKLHIQCKRCGCQFEVSRYKTESK